MLSFRYCLRATMESARGSAISSTKAERYSTQDVAKAVPWIARLDHQVEVGVQKRIQRAGMPASPPPLVTSAKPFFSKIAFACPLRLPERQ